MFYKIKKETNMLKIVGVISSMFHSQKKSMVILLRTDTGGHTGHCVDGDVVHFGCEP